MKVELVDKNANRNPPLTERDLAILIASIRLADSTVDPDSDFSILARQFLRAVELL